MMSIFLPCLKSLPRLKPAAVCGAIMVFVTWPSFAQTMGAEPGGDSPAEMKVGPAPAPDIAIKELNASTFAGAGIVSQDANRQSTGTAISAGETASYIIAVQKQERTRQVLLKLSGVEEVNGWTVNCRLDDETLRNVTREVSSPAGWTTSVGPDDIKLRLEVTAPESLNAPRDFEVQFTATAPGADQEFDIVRAITTATPSIQPDLEIKHLEDRKFLGSGLVDSSGVGQKRSVLAPVLSPQVFQLRVHNSSEVAGDVLLQGEAVLKGWKVSYFMTSKQSDSEVPGSLLVKGWRLKNLAPGEVREAKIVIEAEYPPPEDHPFRLSARGGAGGADTVIAEVLPQYIQGLEVDLKGDEKYLSVAENGAIVAPAGTTFSIRAIPGIKRPNQGIGGWPIVEKRLSPTWKAQQGEPKILGGSMIALQVPKGELGTEFGYSVTCGNTKTFRMKVGPSGPDSYRVSIWQDYKAPPNPESKAKRRVVGALVTTSKGQPVEGVQVTFTGTGLIVVPPTDPKLPWTTDKGGYATILVESTGEAAGTVVATVAGGGPDQRAQCKVQF